MGGFGGRGSCGVGWVEGCVGRGGVSVSYLIP